jgi:hypothetical protein
MALIRPSTFFRHVSSPRSVVEDFIEVVRQAGDNRWRIGIAAAACTIALFSLMWKEEVRGKPRPPEVTYITVWDPHRTEAQIIASNIENQKRKDRLAAEQAKRDEDIRQMYKTLGRMSGMDVDAIERKAKAEQAAEAAAQKKAAQQAAARQAAAASPAPQQGPSHQ